MNEQEFQIADDGRRKVDYLWLLSCVLITATAAFLRFFQLELKPMHHDEGVNGYFLTTLSATAFINTTSELPRSRSLLLRAFFLEAVRL
jgi:hypothetical protein